MQTVQIVHTSLVTIINEATAALAAVNNFMLHTHTHNYAGEGITEDVQCSAAMQLHVSCINETSVQLCNIWNIETF